jgi:hypothetical protein
MQSCDCDGFPFLVAGRASLNNDATVGGSLGANDPNGQLRIGRRVFLADGTTAAGSIVRLGDEASVFDVSTDMLFEGPTSQIRGTRGMVTLPLVSPFCTLPQISCTPGNDLIVPAGDTASPPPGSYGRLQVGDGATLNLVPGVSYDFCDARVGRYANVQSTGQVTINVTGNIRMGAGSRLWTPAIVNDLPVVLNIGGSLVRISQADVVEAIITAPNAKIRIQRAGELYGCFCADELRTDKNVLMECVE